MRRQAGKPDTLGGEKRVTLRLVAEAAGVDKSTISRLLSGDPRLSVRADTRARILQVVEDLGYRPNPVARGLRTSRTGTLGIVVASLDNPVYAQIIQSVEAAAAARGYSLVIAHTSDKLGELADVSRRLVVDHRVDGLILTTLRDDALLPAIRALNVPVVLVNRRAAGSESWVALDDEVAAWRAVSELVALGHREIAYVAGARDRYNARCRLAGYRRALDDAGIALREELVVEAPYTATGGREAMAALLGRRRRFTAVFAVTLVSAAGAMAALQDAGIDVPGAVSVVGFHDGVLSELLRPTLSTVRLDVEGMGLAAAEGIIDVIEGRQKDLRLLLDRSVFVARDSTAPPRRE